MSWNLFFLNKRGQKLGCVLYTGAHYTRVNTAYENYMCELWLKKRIWKWSLQLRSSESLCLKCRKGLNFFRPYFHYYLSSVHITVRVTSILLLFNCSSHIWFSYIYSHLLTTSQGWFDIHLVWEFFGKIRKSVKRRFCELAGLQFSASYYL